MSSRFQDMGGQMLLQMSTPPLELPHIVGGLIVYFLAFLIPWLACCYLVYFFVSLPLRRRERARLFLQIVETGLDAGKTPERTIVEAAASRDRMPGVRFHLLAALIESGQGFGPALRQVPHLLPPNVALTLQAGLETNDLRRVLMTCREALRDASSHVQAALNFVPVSLLISFPIQLALLYVMAIFIWPRMLDIFTDLGVRGPSYSLWLFGHIHWITAALSMGLGIMLALGAGYIGGPRLTSWLRRLWPGAVDRFQYRLPWRRRRMLRDFNAMLAMLLDAEVPETRALELAARTTDNQIFQHQVEEVRHRLRAGIVLPQALAALNDCDLSWRMSLAGRGNLTFWQALAVWRESVEAQAFRQEQTTAQIAAALFVLFNGLVIGAVAVAFFLFLIQLITEATLW